MSCLQIHMYTHTYIPNSMPVKLFPVLRFLSTPLSFAHFHTIKPIPPIKSASRVTPIHSRISPHKLSCRILGVSHLSHNPQLGVRRFSALPTRIRSESGSEARASKSLIEDEADLSDWVNGLRSDSFHKTMVYSDSDDDERDDFLGRNRARNREERGGKRRRGDSSYDDDDDVLSTGRGGRDSFDSLSRNSKGKRRFGADLERENDGFRSRGRENGSRGGDLGRENDGFKSRGKRENGSRGGDLGRENDGFKSRGKRENGYRGGKDFSIARKGGGTAAFGNVRGHDTGRAGGGGGLRNGGKNFRRGGLVELDEDNVDEDEDEFEKREKIVKGFRELISEQESEDEDEDDDDDNFFKKEDADSIASPISSASGSNSYLSETRFDQCPISPLSLKAIKDAGYEKMTVVQESTLPVILKGKDVLAKARTGTGKTVAFLLPSIELVGKSAPVGHDQKRPPILVLVICPTRELASQAASEANTLLKYHPSIGVQVVIGGTRLAFEQKRMQANPCQILVATPGRLRDHIENTAGFATRLMGVKVLVLDEADHLLDMGFRKDIEKIIAAVPKQRQTLLFSATIPQEVRQICHIALKRDHEFINTVEEGSEETHSQVQQMHLVAPLDKHFSILYALLKEHIADDVDYKVLVFCTTAMVTRLVADLLGELNLNVREIHSRKPQSYRTRVSDEFRKSRGLILVTSDVSARGVDYPDVTLVVQVGLPADRQQYIHRLGRTGRRGKEGQGVLLLAPWEEFFLSTVKDLPLTKAAVPLVDPDTRKKVEKALSHVEMKNKEAAYQAWLGYYNSNKNVGRDKYKLVELANEFSRSMGLDNPPAITKVVLGKMGLRNIPGLRSR